MEELDAAIRVRWEVDSASRQRSGGVASSLRRGAAQRGLGGMVELRLQWAGRRRPESSQIAVTRSESLIRLINGAGVMSRRRVAAEIVRRSGRGTRRGTHQRRLKLHFTSEPTIT